MHLGKLIVGVFMDQASSSLDWASLPWAGLGTKVFLPWPGLDILFRPVY